MAVDRRLLAGSIGVAVVISVIGGWAVSRSDTQRGELDAVLDTPGVEQYPSIATNAEVAGDALPVIDLQTNEGQAISTADLLGRPLVLNYWYSTCAPCKKELPAFAAVDAEFGDRVRFVGVNPQDVPETNESFARDRGVQYELLRDPDGAYSAAVGVTSAPFTVFVAADGTIVRQAGVLDEEQLRTYVAELIG
jgi:peroxiredoxin